MTDMQLEKSPDALMQRQDKPRIALMGEFSAGKSTLLNLFLGCDPMPVRITATRVPPVWVTYGTEAAVRVRDDGTEEAIEIEDLAGTPVEGTRMVRLSLDADILRLCDLIDIPGISDPNMRHEDWAGLLGDIDLVIWCTHATQAWRQSEAALWEQVSQSVPGPNYLAVTQFDKLRSERDRARVLSRLQAEVEGVFDGIFPIATLDAINSGVDEVAWEQSGGAAFVEQLVSDMAAWPELQTRIAPEAVAEELPADFSGDAVVAEDEGEDPRLELSLQAETSPEDDGPGIADASSERVLPRRVRPKTMNPDRPEASELAPMVLDGSEIRTGL